jgi:hypothetical protein
MSPAQAQQKAASDAPAPSSNAEKDALHLNTIGAFSAGFVLQSYGYIGALADALSKKVYTPDFIRPMLAETTAYLRNVNGQLKKYHGSGLESASDRKFVDSVIKIIEQLIIEAEALASFAQTTSAEDLKRYDDARKNALQLIKKTFNVN